MVCTPSLWDVRDTSGVGVGWPKPWRLSFESPHCAVHKCVLDFTEFDNKPRIGDPEVGNPSPVDGRTLPIRLSSLGAGQTVNEGGKSESLILTQVRLEGTTATSDVDSKKKNTVL